MRSIVDLAAQGLVVPAGAPLDDTLDWDEFAALWNANEMAAAHDWLNLRWSRRVETRIAGAADPEARFLQGLAFAALALHFTQIGNQDGALLMLDDALIALAPYRPAFLGVQVDPVVATLQELRPTVASLAADAEYPGFPFVYRRFEHRH
jgi:hypothetical protein